jgi:hypothetical protein
MPQSYGSKPNDHGKGSQARKPTRSLLWMLCRIARIVGGQACDCRGRWIGARPAERHDAQLLSALRSHSARPCPVSARGNGLHLLERLWRGRYAPGQKDCTPHCYQLHVVIHPRVFLSRSLVRGGGWRHAIRPSPHLDRWRRAFKSSIGSSKAAAARQCIGRAMVRRCHGASVLLPVSIGP